MSVELKIKSKHLALEPAIIRKEERKLQKRIRNYKQYYQITGDRWDAYKDHPDLYKLYDKRGSLFYHRITDVRNESRATFLARAYIKGLPYKAVEAKCRDLVTFEHRIIPRVLDMVAKYGNKKIYKRWDIKTNKKAYKTEEYEELMSAIRKWCELDD